MVADLRLLLAFVVAAMLGACTPAVVQRVQDHGSGEERIELSNTAFFPNEDRAAAAAALATMFYTDGLTSTGPLQVAPFLGNRTPPANLRGEFTGIAYQLDRLAFVLPPTLDAVFAEIRAGRPVMVLQKVPELRYAVVIGVEPQSNQMILRSGKEGRVYQPLGDFLSYWKGGDNWAMVISDGSRVPASATQASWIAVGEAATLANYPKLAEKNAYGAIERWPDQVVPWVALGNARYALKDWAGAQEAYLESLRLKAFNPVVRNNLALVLLERHCVDLAEQQLDEALKGETDAALKAAYEGTRQKISRYEGPSIYCPPPDDASAPIEYEIAPLNPETPNANRVRRRAR